MSNKYGKHEDKTVIENFFEVLMRVGKKFGDKIAIPQAKKRFGWAAKNLTEFFNIFLSAIEEK